jgi:hypothetical protein
VGEWISARTPELLPAPSYREQRKGADCRALIEAHAPFSQRLTASSLFPPIGDVRVPRRIKDFIDISEYTSLDDLIRYLETIRDNLPTDHEAELKIRGDDVFGRRLTITYLRDKTPEEAELETKYADGGPEDPEMEQLRRKLDDVPYRDERGSPPPGN